MESKERIFRHSFRLLTSKSLKWSEIEHVSMRGQSLRLHSHNEDVVLSLDSQVERYADILDIVFSKRPDLFDVGENTLMSSGWSANLLVPGFVLFLISISVLLFSESEGLDKFFSVIFFALGVYAVVSWFLSPKSVALDDRSLLLMYFLRKFHILPRR